MDSSATRAIYVLATRFEGTRAALATAIPLARGLDARLIVLVPSVIRYVGRTFRQYVGRTFRSACSGRPEGRPYNIGADRLADSAELMMRRYRDVVSDLNGDAQFRLCVCRRPDDVLTQLLTRHATVVIGGPTGALFPTQEAKLVRRLTKLGHHVVFVPTPNQPSLQHHQLESRLAEQPVR